MNKIILASTLTALTFGATSEVQAVSLKLDAVKKVFAKVSSKMQDKKTFCQKGNLLGGKIGVCRQLKGMHFSKQAQDLLVNAKAGSREQVLLMQQTMLAFCAIRCEGYDGWKESNAFRKAKENLNFDGQKIKRNDVSYTPEDFIRSITTDKIKLKDDNASLAKTILMNMLQVGVKYISKVGINLIAGKPLPSAPKPSVLLNVPGKGNALDLAKAKIEQELNDKQELLLGVKDKAEKVKVQENIKMLEDPKHQETLVQEETKKQEMLADLQAEVEALAAAPDEDELDQGELDKDTVSSVLGLTPEEVTDDFVQKYKDLKSLLGDDSTLDKATFDQYDNFTKLGLTTAITKERFKLYQDYNKIAVGGSNKDGFLVYEAVMKLPEENMVRMNINGTMIKEILSSSGSKVDDKIKSFEAAYTAKAQARMDEETLAKFLNVGVDQLTAEEKADYQEFKKTGKKLTKTQWEAFMEERHPAVEPEENR